MLGEICLFVSLAATGYAAFLSLWFGRRQSRLQQRIVLFALNRWVGRVDDYHGIAHLGARLARFSV